MCCFISTKDLSWELAAERKEMDRKIKKNYRDPRKFDLEMIVMQRVSLCIYRGNLCVLFSREKENYVYVRTYEQERERENLHFHFIFFQDILSLCAL